jgi:hypothetical protein
VFTITLILKGYNLNISRFQPLDMLVLIADTWNSTTRIGIMDITNFFSPLKFQLCWRNHRFHSRYPHHYILYAHTIQKVWILTANPGFHPKVLVNIDSRGSLAGRLNIHPVLSNFSGFPDVLLRIIILNFQCHDD